MDTIFLTNPGAPTAAANPVQIAGLPSPQRGPQAPARISARILSSAASDASEQPR
jgi:hypothetical protein